MLTRPSRPGRHGAGRGPGSCPPQGVCSTTRITRQACGRAGGGDAAQRGHEFCALQVGGAAPLPGGPSPSTAAAAGTTTGALAALRRAARASSLAGMTGTVGLVRGQ